MDEDNSSYEDTDTETDTETEITTGIGSTYVDPNVYVTIKEMLDLRGYQIYKDVDERSVDKQLVGIKNNNLIACLFVTEIKSGQKLNVSKMKYYISLLISSNIFHYIIIHSEKELSSRVNNIISDFLTINNHFTIETFCQESLRYNIIKHKYVPKIEVLSDNEAELFKKNYKHCLQFFLSKDPQIKFYGIKKGAIVKVYRSSGVIVYKLVK